MKIGDLFRKQSQTKAFPSQDNVSFYQLEPEVAGGWGEDTVADTTMQPPRVLQLDYCFDGWLGACATGDDGRSDSLRTRHCSKNSRTSF